MSKLVGFFIALGMFWVVGVRGIFAQEVLPATGGAALVKVDYTLPYPGMLPDNPFYFLKALRDKVVSFFLFDPVKKAEFYVLLSDKRLGAGRALIEGGKISLGENTISEGEKYMEMAVSEASGAERKGKEAGAVWDKVSKATAKHTEVLKEVLERVPKEAKSGIEMAISSSSQREEQVKEVFKERVRRME